MNKYSSLLDFKIFNYRIKVKNNKQRMLFSDRHFRKFEVFGYWIIVIQTLET